ncbi:MAG: hypothetical protein IT162_16475 [Bryobacterales bacterium]|nr:hypothetical protein [Bryobacterales bacterium]
MRSVLASLLTATGLLLSQQQPDSAALPTTPATTPATTAPAPAKKKSGVDRQRASLKRQLGEFLDSPDWFFWPKPLTPVAPPVAAAPAEEPSPPPPPPPDPAAKK